MSQGREATPSNRYKKFEIAGYQTLGFLGAGQYFLQDYYTFWCDDPFCLRFSYMQNVCFLRKM